MTNYHGASLSAFTGAASGVTSTALSPGTGFGVDAGLIEPFGEAIDASGKPLGGECGEYKDDALRADPVCGAGLADQDTAAWTSFATLGAFPRVEMGG